MRLSSGPPSGPTVEDMIANAALLVGLAVGTRDAMNVVLPAIPFRYAEHNFYRAAKHGLGTRLIWPTRRQTALCEASIQDIASMMLPMADEGLDQLGVEESERRHWLGVIRNRLESGLTGARWQSGMVAKLEREMPRRQALRAMLERYRQNNRQGHPVAEWSMDL